VTRRWKEVSAEEKATYDDMAKVDKMRYQREQKQFDAEHGVPEARPKPKPKSKKSKKSKPTEESGEDDEPATTNDEPHQATKPRVLPMPLLELGTLVPRAKHSMRTESIEVGDKLVWVTPTPSLTPSHPPHPIVPHLIPLLHALPMHPTSSRTSPLATNQSLRHHPRHPMPPGAALHQVPQAFDVFDENYASTLDKLSLTDLPNEVSADLMRRPADGTANGAEVLKVSEPSEFAPELKDQLHGWQLLRLKSLDLPGGEAGPEGLEYNLPVIRRSECDVDMHVCSLEQYEASKRWKIGCGSESQVSTVTPPPTLAPSRHPRPPRTPSHPSQPLAPPPDPLLTPCPLPLYPAHHPSPQIPPATPCHPLPPSATPRHPSPPLTTPRHSLPPPAYLFTPCSPSHASLWKPCHTPCQVCVRFADEDGKQEEEWEGRIWDEQPHAPNEYPNSTYKRLRLLWCVTKPSFRGCPPMYSGCNPMYPGT
jgi:hypothetical protein